MITSQELNHIDMYKEMSMWNPSDKKSIIEEILEKKTGGNNSNT